MRVLELNDVISNVRFPSLNEGMNRLEMKVDTLSKRKSEKFKINLSRIFIAGSIALFIFAYNITPDMPNYENETPVGINR